MIAGGAALTISRRLHIAVRRAPHSIRPMESHAVRAEPLHFQSATDRRPHTPAPQRPLTSLTPPPPSRRRCGAAREGVHFGAAWCACRGDGWAEAGRPPTLHEFLASTRPLHIPNPPVPRFSFLVSGFKGGPLSWDLRRAHFSIPISRFSLHRLQRIERR